MESKKKRFGLNFGVELSDPRVLHFLKTSAKKEEGMSKAVYKEETPRGDCTYMRVHLCACVYD